MDCRKYRVISGEAFLGHFSSDRSHMRRADGSWLAEPPSYAPIKNGERKMNLHQYMDMGNSDRKPDGTNADLAGPYGIVFESTASLINFVMRA